MRLSFITASAIAAVAAIALAACGGHGVVPAPSTAMAPNAVTPDDALTPMTSGDEDSPLLTTCATSPPQYWWIFKGACDLFKLKSSGGTFTLPKYKHISVTGLIGKNNAKATVKVAIADAVDKSGDITAWKGKPFPAYKANGATIVYASVVNQSKQTIRPIPVKNKAVLQYTITDSKGFPGHANQCGAALLGAGKGGKLQWTAFPGTGTVKGKSVTITVYEAPQGFELPPKGTPLYFAINCYKQ